MAESPTEVNILLAYAEHLTLSQSRRHCEDNQFLLGIFLEPDLRGLEFRFIKGTFVVPLEC